METAKHEKVTMDELQEIQKEEENDDDKSRRDLITLNKKIFQILAEAIGQIEIALCIPELIKRQDNLQRYMANTHKLKLIYLCSKYLGKNIQEDTKFDQQIEIDYQLIKAIDLIHKNEKIRKDVDKFLENLSPETKKLFQIIKEFKMVAELRLQTSARLEMAKERILHKMWQENQRLMQKITKFRSVLHEKEISIQWKISEKQALIKKYKQDLSDKKWKNNILIKKEVEVANKKMIEICNISEARQSQLREDVNKKKIEYETLLAQNLEIDKNLREQKENILARLKDGIKEYDNNIGDKTRELEKLTVELQENTARLNEFKEEFYRQEQEYFLVVSLKEAEEKQAQQEKMLIFMMNRAARIIQECWRQYQQRKKKKGKGKGKAKKAKK